MMTMFVVSVVQLGRLKSKTLRMAMVFSVPIVVVGTVRLVKDIFIITWVVKDIHNL